MNPAIRYLLLAAAATLLPLLAARAFAFEVELLQVRRAQARYIVEFKAHLDAPAEQVGAVLKDYERYPDLDPRILESRLDEENPTELHTKLRGCVGRILCRTMHRVEMLKALPDSLVATAVPGEGDVRYGLTRCQWQASDGGTDLSYRLEIEPDFWVPPLFGPPLMIKTLREGTLSLFRNVERVAIERAAGEHE